MLPTEHRNKILWELGEEQTEGGLVEWAGPTSDSLSSGPETATASQPRGCVEDVTPCVRPALGRLVLGVTAAGAVAAGGLWMMRAGDSMAGGDPGGAMIGGGMLAFAGVLTGMIADLSAREHGALSVAQRSPTLAVALSGGSSGVLGERHPLSAGLSWAPRMETSGGRLGLTLRGGLGVNIGQRVEVDPRPQAVTSDGGLPEALRSHAMDFDLALEGSFALAYPSPKRRRPALLGPVELRWRAGIELTRHHYQPGTDEGQVIEQLFLLPLVPGLRWHLSQRQRFTFFVGPSIDFVSYRNSGESWQRGGGRLARAYARAAYEIDIPLAPQGRGPVDTNGRLSLLYRHGGATDDGFDQAAVVGFLGPFGLRFDLQLRRAGAPLATQVGLGAWVGRGVTGFLEIGLVAPPLSHTGDNG